MSYLRFESQCSQICKGKQCFYIWSQTTPFFPPPQRHLCYGSRNRYHSAICNWNSTTKRNWWNDSKLSKLVVDIQPLFTLKENVEKIVNSFDTINEKMGILSGVPAAINGLQKQFSEMSDFMKTLKVAPQQVSSANNSRYVKKRMIHWMLAHD